MASYGVFLALCGFEYDGPQSHLGFAPRITPEDFRAAFTTAEGWGTYCQKSDAQEFRAEISVRWGQLKLKNAGLADGRGREAQDGQSHARGERGSRRNPASRTGASRSRFAKPSWPARGRASTWKSPPRSRRHPCLRDGQAGSLSHVGRPFQAVASARKGRRTTKTTIIRSTPCLHHCLALALAWDNVPFQNRFRGLYREVLQDGGTRHPVRQRRLLVSGAGRRRRI